MLSSNSGWGDSSYQRASRPGSDRRGSPEHPKGRRPATRRTRRVSSRSRSRSNCAARDASSALHAVVLGRARVAHRPVLPRANDTERRGKAQADHREARVGTTGTHETGVETRRHDSTRRSHPVPSAGSAKTIDSGEVLRSNPLIRGLIGTSRPSRTGTDAGAILLPRPQRPTMRMFKRQALPVLALIPVVALCLGVSTTRPWSTTPRP